MFIVQLRDFKHHINILIISTNLKLYINDSIDTQKNSNIITPEYALSVGDKPVKVNVETDVKISTQCGIGFLLLVVCCY